MLFNLKISQFRHSRVGGNPVKLATGIDSRLRGNDGCWVFLLIIGRFIGSCKGHLLNEYKRILM